MKPRLLDLCCGAGGATRGYQLAGFHVTGVDIAPQPNYVGDDFCQADALIFPLDGFDVVHASPPCQAWTPLSHLHDIDHPDLVTPVRVRLLNADVPYVIENVPGAPLDHPLLLCGSMFDPPLDVRRHRLFETNWLHGRVPDWPCRHKLWAPRFPPEDRRMKKLSRVVGVYGGGRYKGSDSVRAAAMGIDWMNRLELTQAIPPAYTEWIGRQLLRAMDAAA